MSMTHTYQAGFEKIRPSDVTGQGASTDILDGITMGKRYLSADVTGKTKDIDPACNGVEVIFIADGSDGADFGYKQWGITKTGYLELMVDISGVLGTATVGDTTTDRAVRAADTIGILTDANITACAVKDTGANRIAKLVMDTVGYSRIYGEFYDITEAGSVCENAKGTYINAWLRFF